MACRFRVMIRIIITIMIFVLLCSCERVENTTQNVEEIDKGSQMIYETKEQAEEYAINLFKEKYPDVNLENYNITTEDGGEEYWKVYASLKVKSHKYVKGGGGPSVKFKKMDGSILEIGLQK